MPVFAAIILLVVVFAVVEYMQRRLIFCLDYEKNDKSVVEKQKKLADRLMIGGFVLQLIIAGFALHRQSSDEEEARANSRKLSDLREMAKSSPAVPVVALTTQTGLPHPWPYSKEIGPKEQELFRYLILEISNTNKVNVNALSVEMLLPEPVFQFYETQTTAGVTISLRPPPRGILQGSSINGGTLTQVGERSNLPIRQWTMETPLLPADGFVKLHLLTRQHPRVPRAFPGERPAIYLQGSFKFASDNRVETKRFSAEFGFDWTNRVVSLGPNMETQQLWEVQEFDF